MVCGGEKGTEVRPPTSNISLEKSLQTPSSSRGIPRSAALKPLSFPQSLSHPEIWPQVTRFTSSQTRSTSSRGPQRHSGLQHWAPALKQQTPESGPPSPSSPRPRSPGPPAPPPSDPGVQVPSPFSLRPGSLSPQPLLPKTQESRSPAAASSLKTQESGPSDPESRPQCPPSSRPSSPGPERHPSSDVGFLNPHPLLGSRNPSAQPLSPRDPSALSPPPQAADPRGYLGAPAGSGSGETGRGHGKPRFAAEPSERARGRQRGPRPGLAHSGDSSWASVDAPPRPPAPPSRCAPKWAADTHRLPGPPGGFGLGRRRGGPARKAPPTRAQQGPIGARCGNPRPRPSGDAPANQEERLAGRANQKLPESASRGKRTAPQRRVRRRGRGRDPRPDGQRVRPMARREGLPGGGRPKGPG
ncbi:PREDICTED: proline-rich protein HaeIII subfamily 1-like [Ceratotherium simum simum]|uniref:Proline-rich protein HaeIII subfamily 1-like n=1 Tax=Ceratotherium simum simum TaxID=73337 RepID=A0ABM1DFK2_CERSS|nr:PREDICTED: proline-rich protein HaeIII subfamily 1-like [Ceratotherium simum simum]